MKVLVAAFAVLSILQVVASGGPVEETPNIPEHGNQDHAISKPEEKQGPLMKAILTPVEGDSTPEQKREKRTFKKGGGGGCGSGCCSGGCGGGGGGGSGSYSSSSSKSGSWGSGKK